MGTLPGALLMYVQWNYRVMIHGIAPKWWMETVGGMARFHGQ